MLNFGSNVLEAHTNHTSTAQRLTRALAERKVRMVTFDVRLSITAAKSAEWVPIKPGTDIAVVLAMSNVVMEEGLYRGEGEDFLKFCCATKAVDATTNEKVAALKAHLAQYPPESPTRTPRASGGRGATACIRTGSSRTRVTRSAARCSGTTPW